MRPCASVLAALLPLMLPAAGSAHAQEPPDLIVEVRLDGHQLSDATAAYQQGGDIHLPLCEMARLLTLAIRCDTLQGRASGYLLDEQRGFFLDAQAGSASIAGRAETVDPGALLRKADDIYVASRLLARWLPVDLALDMPNLAVQVRAREQLPLQARLARQAKGRPGTGGPAAGPAHARVDTPYALFDAPFIDQTVSMALRPGASTASYSAYASGDLLGMEAALYVARGGSGGNSGNGARGTRLTMGRHDPDGALLGPLRARTALAGSVSAMPVEHIAAGRSDGAGFVLSNRPLSQPALLDRHSLRGDLAPGWDVELFYNDTLAGFQQSREDGKYAFEDLPLNYGPNEFRLVFHGPLGQLRVERHSILLESTQLARGDLTYHLTHQRLNGGGARTAALFDWGLASRLTAGAALVQLRGAGRDARQQRYASLTLNGYWDRAIGSAALVRSDDAGALAQLAVRTRVAGMAVSASRAVAERFVSELYPGAANPVRLRDELRADGSAAGLYLAMRAARERRAGGDETREASLRTSAFRLGTAISHLLHWRADALGRRVDGTLQGSRRLAGIGLSGQLVYILRPRQALSTLNLSMDTRPWPGYVLNLTAAHSFEQRDSRIGAALNKSLGRFGMGVGLFASRRGEFGATVQLFTSLGREPRRALWSASALPLAASGAASALVFVDRNRNGMMDAGDEAVQGAGFAVNGGAHLARTGEDGVAFLGRLAPGQYLDIALDSATLEDPQWQPRRAGVRIVPRAGKVSQLEFPVGVTAEIDGTTWLLEHGARRAVGAVELQLRDERGEVVAAAASGADGYYVIGAVAPGRYRLGVAPGQLARLGMRPVPGAGGAPEVTVGEDGAFVNGKDVLLERVPEEVETAPRQAGQ